MDHKYYKKDKPLSESLKELDKFIEDGHCDKIYFDTQDNCPHIDKRQDSTFVYTGHNHNDDIYECTLCGKLEYR